MNTLKYGLILLSLSPLTAVSAQSTQPPDDAAKLYLQAAKLVDANDAKNIMSPAASDITYPDYPPFSPEWLKMEKEDFAANKEARDLIRQARSIDHADWPPIKQGDFKTYYLNECRNLANEVGDAAVWQHLQGDDAAAIESVRDVLHLADLLEHGDSHKTLVNTLVSVGIRALAINRLDDIISSIKLTNDPNDHQSLQTSDAKEMIDYLLKRPDAQSELEDLEATEHIRESNNPSIDIALITFARVNGECAMAAVSMACHLYRFDHNDWPKSIDDLQKYLPKPPIDPFGDGKQTIGYVLIKAGLPDGTDRPLVYNRSELKDVLFYRTDRPSYSYYTDADPTKPTAKQNHGGQFRDIASWVPKPGTPPATQPIPSAQAN